MKLTQKQESLITRYLREVAVQLDTNLPQKVRERGLARLSAQITRGLNGLGKETVDDADVMGVLARLGTPAAQAASLKPSGEPERSAPPTSERIWLGVCMGVARRLDLEPWTVRTLAVILGFLTGPVAVTVYLILAITTERDAHPPIAPLRVIIRVGATLAAALALHLGTAYCVRLIYFVHEVHLKRPIPEMGDWAWVDLHGGQALFWALFLCLPVAALSAMPLANAWEQSLKRAVQAGLALYGIVLSFGIAATLVGLILDFVRDFAGQGAA